MNDFEIVEDLEAQGYDVEELRNERKKNSGENDLKIMNSVPYPHPTNNFVDYGNDYYQKFIKPVSSKTLQKRGKRVAKQERADDANKLLKAMNHNPVSHLLVVYKRCERELERLEQIRDGNLEGKYSQVAYNELLGQMAKINTDLLRYRYARVSETVQVDNKGAGSLCIELTTPETYNPKEN